MKNVFFTVVLFLLFGGSVFAQDDRYFDLGLPSGTLWKDTNEGYYTYNEAYFKYVEPLFESSPAIGPYVLPSIGQLLELMEYCTWECNTFWQSANCGIGSCGWRVTGPNGNSIFLPLDGANDGWMLYNVGTKGTYWSKTMIRGDNGEYGVYSVELSNTQYPRPYDNLYLYSILYKKLQYSVRLIKDIEKLPKYVDLGLSSGTKWCDVNETGLFEFEEAVRMCSHSQELVDNHISIPTKTQWDELIKECKWKWIDGERGWKVTGPNGNSITLPASGHFVCEPKYRKLADFGSRGGYMSSTPDGSDGLWGLHFESNYYELIEMRNIVDGYSHHFYSVRLVQSVQN